MRKILRLCYCCWLLTASSSLLLGPFDKRQGIEFTTPNIDSKSVATTPVYDVRITKFTHEEPKKRPGFLLYAIPFFAPLFGFAVYDQLASISRQAVVYLAQNSWMLADGGQYKAEILAPAINGIVVPTISISLATLVAGTLSSLRDRQTVIRSCLNREACDLKVLHSTLLYMTRNSSTLHQRNLLSLLYMYNSRLVKESCPGRKNTKKATALSSELPKLLDYVLFHATSAECDFTILGSVQSLISALNAARSNRITMLQTRFPLVHWAVIAVLGVAILLCFMLETDQDTLRFLDDTQLRILFAFLMSAVSSTALLCFDLSQPFTFGFYTSRTSTPPCVAQLADIRLELERDLL